VLDRAARGESVDEIVREAARRRVRVERATAERVTRLSRNGRHDQGVVAEVRAPGLVELGAWLGGPAAAGPLAVLLLDGLTNPANVGMIIRSATAAGLDGVVLPRAGSPDIGPLVVKASAGIALSATILVTSSALEGARALADAGVTLVGLAADAPSALWTAELPARLALVIGNETDGISTALTPSIASWLSIPLTSGVESLNAAVAASVVAFELARRRA